MEPEIQTLEAEALIGPVQACKILGVSRTSLYRLTRSRDIPHYGYFTSATSAAGHRYRYKASDLIAWREAHRIEAITT